MKLSLSGRMDTNTTPQASQDIDQYLRGQENIDRLTVDASKLTYISSSGLRLLLSLAKRYRNFRLTEVQSKIYNILETTGFTKIMTVEKALRRISVEGCEMIGRGGIGAVYRLDGDTIIKVFREGTTMAEVKHETDMSKEAFFLGLPTAISYDVVHVGNRYGLVYELLQAETLSDCIKREPQHLDEFARKFAQLFRQLHTIEVTESNSLIPDAIGNERKAVSKLTRYFSDSDVELLLQIIDAIPQGNRLLHLDLQTKNIMKQGDDLMLIDLGEIGYGHPLLDLGHAYSPMVALIGDYEKIVGMPKQLSVEVWNKAVRYYFEGETEETIAHRIAQIEAVACVRNFSWMSLSDSFPEDEVRKCKAIFDERVRNRRDYLLDISKTFNDWPL